MNKEKLIPEILEVRKLLSAYSEIAFAYLHGSSLTSHKPRDLDIAVFILEKVFEELSNSRETLIRFAIPLEMEIEKMVGRKTDLQVLNHAPLSFRHRVVQSGLLILDNDVDLRCRFEYLSRYPYFDFRHRRMMYLEEALA